MKMFMTKLTWNMKLEPIKEGDKVVNKQSPNIVETSYLRLCDDSEEFNHNMMGEVFLHYVAVNHRNADSNYFCNFSGDSRYLDKEFQADVV